MIPKHTDFVFDFYLFLLGTESTVHMYWFNRRPAGVKSDYHQYRASQSAPDLYCWLASFKFSSRYPQDWLMDCFNDEI